MTDPFVVAVDVGATKTAALAATLDDRGTLRVLGFCLGPSAGTVRGSVEDVHQFADSVGSAVSQLERSIEFRIDQLALGLGGVEVSSKQAQGLLPIVPAGRSLTREDVLQVVRHSRQSPEEYGREQFFAAPARFIVNGREETTKPLGQSAQRLEVQTTLVFGSSERIQKVESAIDRIDRDILQLTPTAFASASGVLGSASATTLTAVIDIGFEKTDIALFDRGAPTALFFVPIGSRHFTTDIAKLLKTSNEEAERLKLTFGALPESKLACDETVDVLQSGQIHARPLDRKVLSQIVGSRVRELARLVRGELSKTGNIGKLTGGLVLTGGGAKLSGIVEYFELEFSEVTVHVAWPKIQHVELSDPSMSAVVGLARIALLSADDDLAPASGISSWKERIRTFRLKLTSRA